MFRLAIIEGTEKAKVSLQNNFMKYTIVKKTKRIMNESWMMVKVTKQMNS